MEGVSARRGVSLRLSPVPFGERLREDLTFMCNFGVIPAGTDSSNPDYEGWVEMPESHFKKLEENECLEQILEAVNQGEGFKQSQQQGISCSL